MEFYTGVGERMKVPVVLPPTPPLVDLAGLKVLVADDVADSGIMLAMVRDLVRPNVAELRTAVLYKKPWSVVEPDYFRPGQTVGSISPGRPVRPWSSGVPVDRSPRDERTDR